MARECFTLHVKPCDSRDPRSGVQAACLDESVQVSSQHFRHGAATKST